jgi:hypothetical protein
MGMPGKAGKEGTTSLAYQQDSILHEFFSFSNRRQI